MFQFWKFATAGIICGSLLLGDPALANSIKQGYRVSLLGVDVYEVTLAINLKQNSYAAQLGLEAAGMAGFLSSGRIDATARGNLAKGTAQPQTFTMSSDTFGEKHKLSVVWKPEAAPQTKRNFKITPATNAAISKVLSSSTLGPLAALISHLILPSKKACSGAKRVYTGKAVYDYSLTPQGTEKLNGEDEGSYRGTAYKCRATYRRIAGVSGKFVEAMQDNPPSPVTVWYAPISQGNSKMLLPVAAVTKVKGQAVKIRLHQAGD